MPIIKSIDMLDPTFRPLIVEFTMRLADKGIAYRIDETLRTREVQDAYFVQGRAPLAEVNHLRSKAGLYLLTEKENQTIVTWTRESAHFTGCAADIVPVCSKDDGKIFVPWDYVAYAGVWHRMGKIGMETGLEWGGAWEPLNPGGLGKDPPHYQKAA